MTGDPLIDETYAGLLEAFAAPVATPGGISAAALAAAMAAALVERCAAARADGPQPRGPAALRALDGGRRRHSACCTRSPPPRRPIAGPRPPPHPGPAARLRDAATEVAGLARTMERDGPPRLRGEALCAALLAEAAAATAVAVIAANDDYQRLA